MTEEKPSEAAAANNMPDIMPLLPVVDSVLFPNMVANNMYGRSDFLIHGDNPAQNNTASEGCIVLPPRCRAGIPTGETVRVIP